MNKKTGRPLRWAAWAGGVAAFGGFLNGYSQGGTVGFGIGVGLAVGLTVAVVAAGAGLLVSLVRNDE